MEEPETILVDVEPDDDRLVRDLLPVLQELRPHLTAESLPAIYREGHPQGLRFTGAYRDGVCVGVAGWRVIATTLTGRKLHVDDLVTAGTARSAGVGRLLLAYLRGRAASTGCAMLDLDSGVHRFGAHRFYLRERLDITAHHFSTMIEPSDPAG